MVKSQHYMQVHMSSVLCAVTGKPQAVSDVRTNANSARWYLSPGHAIAGEHPTSFSYDSCPPYHPVPALPIDAAALGAHLFGLCTEHSCRQQLTLWRQYSLLWLCNKAEQPPAAGSFFGAGGHCLGAPPTLCVTPNSAPLLYTLVWSPLPPKVLPTLSRLAVSTSTLRGVPVLSRELPPPVSSTTESATV